MPPLEKCCRWCQQLDIIRLLQTIAIIKSDVGTAVLAKVGKQPVSVCVHVEDQWKSSLHLALWCAHLPTPNSSTANQVSSDWLTDWPTKENTLEQYSNFVIPIYSGKNSSKQISWIAQHIAHVWASVCVRAPWECLICIIAADSSGRQVSCSKAAAVVSTVDIFKAFPFLTLTQFSKLVKQCTVLCFSLCGLRTGSLRKQVREKERIQTSNLEQR